MTEGEGRGAYLSALGIEQWRPRAVAQSESGNQTPPVEKISEASVPADASAAAIARPPAQALSQPYVEDLGAVERVEKLVAIPTSDQLQDNHASEALALATVSWQRPPTNGSRLSVLAIDARGPHLQAGHIEQERDVLQKMLAAIGEDINRCALGALAWGAEPSVSLATPYALLLVDSGEDAAALIRYWQEKRISVQGAQAVIAPHPRMFSQGTAIKRQAWTSLQMLQQLWAD